MAISHKLNGPKIKFPIWNNRNPVNWESTKDLIQILDWRVAISRVWVEYYSSQFYLILPLIPTKLNLFIGQMFWSWILLLKLFGNLFSKLNISFKSCLTIYFEVFILYPNGVFDLLKNKGLNNITSVVLYLMSKLFLRLAKPRAKELDKN